MVPRSDGLNLCYTSRSESAAVSSALPLCGTQRAHIFATVVVMFSDSVKKQSASLFIMKEKYSDFGYDVNLLAAANIPYNETFRASFYQDQILLCFCSFVSTVSTYC